VLTIPCPWCGPRGEHEFTYVGEAGVTRPTPAGKVSDAEWARYLYGKRNEKGLHRELWVHGGGCGGALVVERDTVTHAVVSAVRADAPGSEPK